jgi:hypothetical protein
VQLPFGGRETEGIVVERVGVPERAGELKSITRVLSPIPIASAQSLVLIDNVADHFAANPWDVIRSAIPPRVASVDKNFAHQGLLSQGKGKHSVEFQTIAPYTQAHDQLVKLVLSNNGSGSVLVIAPDEKDVDLIIQSLDADGVKALKLTAAMPREERYRNYFGIPHYLNQVTGGKSAIQNIDEICFHTDGLLRTEFDNLYSSLFANPERYESIISALSSTWKGMSRMEIIAKTKILDGGGLTMMLQELEQSGFISSYIPFGKKKKDTLFRLTDCYSLFYLKFIRDIPAKETIAWQSLSQTQTWITWSGYAFENICFHHIDNIKAALGIAGVHTNQYSFLSKPSDENEGAQIDLLIDRQDNVISLCEVKFYNDELVLTKADADSLRRKKSIFRHVTGTKKQIFIVVITTFGLLNNKHSLGLVDNVLDMNALF